MKYQRQGQLAGRSIFIAEDDELLAPLLVTLIELHGGTVVGPVASEDEARAILDTTAFDAAILDVRLSGGTCFALAEDLAKRNISVSLITGYTPAEIPVAYSHLPVFSKPFSLEALIAFLADACRDPPDMPEAPVS